VRLWLHLLDRDEADVKGTRLLLLYLFTQHLHCRITNQQSSRNAIVTLPNYVFLIERSPVIMHLRETPARSEATGTGGGRAMSACFRAFYLSTRSL
jgi:hypothetical protein